MVWGHDRWDCCAKNDRAFGDAPAIPGFDPGPLYTLQPGDQGYETTDIQHLTPGYGYGMYYPGRLFFSLGVSARTASTVQVGAGACAMVGNPSTASSALVQGASRVYTYAASTQTYVAQALLGIGQGAWACNDTAVPATVTVSDSGVTTSVDWPACCTPRSFTGNGQARIVFANDSPYGASLALRHIDTSGMTVPGATPTVFTPGPCDRCPEYASGTHAACSDAAVVETMTVNPGRYLLHVHAGGAAAVAHAASSNGPHGPEMATCGGRDTA